MRINTVKQGGGIVGHIRLSATEAKFFKSRFLKLDGSVDTGLKIKQGDRDDYDVTLGAVPGGKSASIRIPVRYFSSPPKRLTKAENVHAKVVNDVMTLDHVDITKLRVRDPVMRQGRSAAAKSFERRLSKDDPIILLANELKTLNQMAKAINAKLWIGTDGKVKAQVSKIITID